jgi:hypothetical protein
MKLKYTCKEAVDVMVAGEDRSLARSEQLLLWLHLRVCEACPRFRNQLAVMRRALRNWRDHPRDL